MKPGKLTVYLFILIIMIFSSCSKKGIEPDMTALSSEEISGERLWERIHTEADYTNYGEWPGHEGLSPGQSPHGVWHKVFTNKPLREALPITTGIAPNGTIIVKENYTSAKELEKLTVMAKVDGYNPETNDWFWAVYSKEGKVLVEGSPDGCISCHSGREDNDYIIIKNMDETLE